ncbi:anti-sigma-I factor RsgI family protein [Desulfotruncus alcoholivorax]|uniref:anti-sigma-I factor RsgI family protein n=1 Tax=Desulfotruncus alcoholivorax TaxID=265477 RepID=UPI0004250727|nr:hypothetical protein [Desulfotruncus alcoholivorax]
MRVKAIVAKVDQENGVMVVFTADKQIRRLPLPGVVPPLGATIEVDLPAEKRAIGGLLHTKWLAAAAVLLVVLAIGMFGTFGVTPVSAYVTLDMKPSLQLAVDDRGKITEVTALNEAGKALLDQLDLKNKDVYLAVREIVQNAGKAGYLDGQKDNIVMAGITKASGSSSYRINEAKLRTIIHDELSARHYPGYVVVNVADSDQWQSAKQSGYSVNQVIMSERARENGVNIDQQELQNQGLAQVMEDHQADIPRWFGENSCEVTWPGRNSAGQPTATNNSRPAGEDEGNEEHGEQTWRPTSPPAGQTNANTQNGALNFSDDDGCASPDQHAAVTGQMDGQNAAWQSSAPNNTMPAGEHDSNDRVDQNNYQDNYQDSYQDNERSESHSWD